jgi:hypothetical protein
MAEMTAAVKAIAVAKIHYLEIQIQYPKKQ